jgi:hypothetical protein
MESKHPASAPSRKPMDDERTQRHHSKLPSIHASKSTPHVSSTPKPDRPLAPSKHSPLPKLSTIEEASITPKGEANVPASQAPKTILAVPLFMPPSMPPGPYKTRLPTEFPSAGISPANPTQDGSTLHRDNTMRGTIPQRDKTMKGMNVHRNPTMRGTILQRDIPVRLPSTRKSFHPGSTQLQRGVYPSQQHQPSVHSSVASHRPAETAPANMKSILTRPEDLVMASRQLKIETMTPRDRDEQETWLVLLSLLRDYQQYGRGESSIC